MVVYVFIAAVAVLSVLIGFSVLAIVRVTAVVNRNIQDKTLELISAYDQVLGEKSRQISELDSEVDKTDSEPQLEVPMQTKANTAAPGLALAIAEQAGKAKYRSRDNAMVYRQVKDFFIFDIIKILENIPGAIKEREEGMATKLLNEISYENFFQLSTLPEAEQYIILKETIPEFGQQMLEQYHQNEQKFSSIGFRDYLMQTKQNELGIIVRIPPNTRCQQLPNYITAIEDPSLCEGVKVEVDGVMYDYAISTREMS